MSEHLRPAHERDALLTALYATPDPARVEAAQRRGRRQGLDLGSAAATS